MKIKVNGKEEIIEQDSISIYDLLKRSRIENPDVVVVQLNSEFVKKETMASTLVKDADEVDFLFFMGGGCS